MIRTDSERFCCMLMIVHVVERKANIKPTSQLLDFKCVDVVLAFPWTSSMIFSVWIHFCSTCSLPRPVSRLAFPGRCQSESEGSVRRIGVRLPANGWWFQIISMMVHVIYIYNILYNIYIYIDLWQLQLMYFGILTYALYPTWIFLGIATCQCALRMMGWNHQPSYILVVFSGEVSSAAPSSGWSQKGAGCLPRNDGFWEWKYW